MASFRNISSSLTWLKGTTVTETRMECCITLGIYIKQSLDVSWKAIYASAVKQVKIHSPVCMCKYTCKWNYEIYSVCVVISYSLCTEIAKVSRMYSTEERSKWCSCWLMRCTLLLVHVYHGKHFVHICSVGSSPVSFEVDSVDWPVLELWPFFDCCRCINR